MTTSPELLLGAAAIILIAYFIRGISGFGSGLIAVPLLAHFLPLTTVVPIILLTDFSASLALGSRHRRHVRWDEIRPLLAFGMIGVVLGTSLLISLPRDPLLMTLGGFVLLFGLRGVLGLHGTRKISRGWAAPAGLTGGTVSALFGTGGPPYVIYLNHRIHDKGELRASFSLLFLIEGATRIVSFVVAGLLLDLTLLTSALLALPLVAIGLWAGSHVHVKISNAQMQRLIGVLLTGSGLSLLARALLPA